MLGRILIVLEQCMFNGDRWQLALFLSGKKYDDRSAHVISLFLCLLHHEDNRIKMPWREILYMLTAVHRTGWRWNNLTFIIGGGVFSKVSSYSAGCSLTSWLAPKNCVRVRFFHIKVHFRTNLCHKSSLSWKKHRHIVTNSLPLQENWRILIVTTWERTPVELQRQKSCPYDGISREAMARPPLFVDVDPLGN